MDCKAAKDVINLYIDNMLDDAEKKRLFSHVKSCDGCKKELDDALFLKKAFCRLEDIEPPIGLGVSAVKKAKKSKLPIFAYASIGVAAVAALIIFLSSGIIPGMNNSLNDSTAKEMALYEPKNQAAAKDEAAGFFQKSTIAQDEAAEMREETTEQEAGDQAMAPSRAEDTMESDESPAEESAEDIDLARFAFSGADAQSFEQIIDTFIEENNIAAKYTQFDSGRTVSFVLDEESFTAFETLVIEAGLLYEGELYPGCFIEINFLK